MRRPFWGEPGHERRIRASEATAADPVKNSTAARKGAIGGRVVSQLATQASHAPQQAS